MTRLARPKRGSGRFRRRQAILVGTEGPSERAFVRFVQHCCDESKLEVHLKVWLGNGGDSLSVVEQMNRYIRMNSSEREFSRRLVLLDQDRIDQDRQTGRDAFAAASTSNIQIVLQVPDLEGVLLRLHKGQEQRFVPSGGSEQALRKVWTKYRKPPQKDDLIRRFTVSDLRRAARHDRYLRELLTVVGLVG